MTPNHKTLTSTTKVSARTQAEDRTRYLASLIDNIPDALISTDLEFNILEWNAAAESIYGWQSVEVLGHPLSELVQSAYVDTTREEAIKTLLENGTWNGEVIQVRKDGSHFPVMSSVSQVKDGTGKPIGFVAVNRDISERKKTEEKVRETQELFRSLFHFSPVAYSLSRMSDHTIVDANPACEELFGYARDEVVGKRTTDPDYWIDQNELQNPTKTFGKEGRLYGFEFAYKTKSGTRGWAIAYANLIEQTGEKYVLSSFVNITERRQAERQILQMKRLYAVLSQVNQTIVRVKSHQELYQSICDVSVQFGEFSAAWIGILEEASGDVRPAAASGLEMDHWPMPIVNIHTGPLSGGLIAQSFHTGRVVTSDSLQTDEHLQSLHDQFERHGFPSSAVVPFRLQGKTIGTLTLISQDAGSFKAQEEIRLLDEMGLDISFALDTMQIEIERKEAEDSIRLAEQQYRLLFEESPVMVVLTEYDNTNIFIAKCNQEFLSTLGYHQDEVLGKSLTGFYSADSKVRLAQTYPQTITGAPLSEERELIARDGRIVPVLLRAVPRVNAEGTVIGTQASYIDITERKQAEQEINWLASFPERNPNPIVEIDSTGAVYYMNPRAQNMFPDLATEGFKHPWLNGLETIMDRLRQGEIQQLQREVQVGDTWYSQPVYYVPDAARLRVYGTDITGRKRTEEKLRESERTLKLFVEYAPAAIAMFDRDMKYIAASQRYLIDYRLAKQVVVGRSHYEIFPDIPQRWKEIHRRCLAGTIEKEEEDPFPRADGSLDWVRWEIHPWHEATGEIGGIILFSEVITERKQAEAALRLENERFQCFVESNIVGIVIANASGRIITANDYYLNILGVTRQDFEGGMVNWRRFTPPEWLAADEQALRELSERGICEPYEKEYVRADGRRVPVYIANAMLPGSDEQIAAFVLDITERKQVERALRESGNRIDAIIASAMDAIISIDAEQRILLLNASAEQMFQCSAAEMIGQPLERFIPGRFQAAHRSHIEQYDRGGTINRAMGRLTTLSGLRSDGEEFPIEVSISQVTVAGKKVFTAILRDVTGRRQAEEKIQRQLEHLNSLRRIDTAISSSFDLPVTLDVVLQQVLSQLEVDASAILLINHEMQTIEYAASRGFGSNALQRLQMKLGEGFAGTAILERRTTHIPNLTETTGSLASSLLEHKSFLEYYGTPLIVKGEVKGVLEIYHRSSLGTDVEWLEFLETLAGQAAIAIDNAQLFENLQRSNAQLEHRVTERTLQLNQTNAELEHANRAKDEFMAAMSHELRTPLNSILGLSETLLEQRRDPLTAYQQRSLQIVQSSGSHLLELINDILDLSKIEAGKFTHFPDVISVRELCRSSLAFVREQAVHKFITIVYHQAADVSTLYADPRRLKQILINLLTNAVKFTPERGHVTLQVHAHPGEDRIQFSVIDTGIGIAIEDLRQLFVPFKQVDSRLTRDYEGTGLGLALVQKLTDLHGGSVDVESEVGKGSRFTINLPLGLDRIAQAEVREMGAERLPDTPAEKSNTRVEEQPAHWIVLLAEDNAANVLTIRDYLENYGYQVVVARDGLDVLDKAEQVHPDIILMDIQMPVMDGFESMRRLRANPHFASTPIIALTAIAMPGDRERCLKAGANEYMSKPASLKKLVTSIKQLLSTQG